MQPFSRITEILFRVILTCIIVGRHRKLPIIRNFFSPDYRQEGFLWLRKTEMDTGFEFYRLKHINLIAKNYNFQLRIWQIFVYYVYLFFIFLIDVFINVDSKSTMFSAVTCSF